MSVPVLVRSSLVGLFALAFSGSLQASPIYRVIDLGFEALALNNRGEVVGQSGTDAVIWTRATGQTVIGPGEAVDINNSGRVVGRDGSTGWIWDPNFGFTEPPGLTKPAAINSHGQIVGQDTVNNGEQGYFWDPSFGFTMVGDFYPGPTVPADLNDSGGTVGTRFGGEPAPFFWEIGATDIRVLDGPDDGTIVDGVFRNGFVRGSATAINESGDIVANALLPSANVRDPLLGCDIRFCERAVIWRDFDLTIIAIGGAEDLNNAGEVVGGTYSVLLDPYRRVHNAFLWSDALGLLNLNDLVDPSDPFFGHIDFQRGTSINDLGWIVADNRYLLLPVPEPTTLLLLGLGLAGIALARPRLD